MYLCMLVPAKFLGSSTEKQCHLFIVPLLYGNNSLILSMSDETDPQYEQYIQIMDDQGFVLEEEVEGEENHNDADYTLYLSRLMQVRSLEDTGATTSSQGQAGGVRHAPEAGDQPSLKRTEGVNPSPIDIDEPEIDGGGEWNRDEIDGLFCPICMEGWTTDGDHQVCCIPCGHIYGMSCIKRWLRQLGNRGKCPQCNRKCRLKDIRVLYASRIVAIDEELQKQVRRLEAKCASLEKRDMEWCKKESEWQKRAGDLHVRFLNLNERTTYLEDLLKDVQRKPLELSSKTGCQGELISGNYFDSELGNQGCPNGFIQLKDIQIEGARFFDVDIHSQTMIVAQRLSGMGGSYTLTKLSLLHPHERENIQLPVGTKVVKDLRVSPHTRLALLASLGKKLFVFSTESNNTILTYDLPTAAWSCTWDVNNSHYMYAGLQNGMVLEFDLRQTLRPVESITGLTGNPIHTMHSLSDDLALGSGIRSVLTASSVGLCHWSFGSSEEKCNLIPESMNQGVCISLAYGPGSGDIVASFRPKIEMAGGGISLSQPLSTQSSPLLGQSVQGSHVYYRSVGCSNGSNRYQKLGSTCANVNDVRLPKSAVIDRNNNESSFFAAGDEATSELVLQQLPSLKVVQRLKVKHPIRDVKYSQILNSELLSCLSDDTLQIFSSSSKLS